MRIADYLDIAAQRYPDREGFVFGRTRLSFEEGRKYTSRIANRLSCIGSLDENAHVAILSKNDPRVTFVQLALNCAGLCWVPLQDRNTPDVNAQILIFAECKLVFFHSALTDHILRLKDLCPAVREWICIDAACAQGVALDEWVKDSESTFDYVPTRSADLALIAPTGGTTGPSKAVAHSHGGLTTVTMHLSTVLYLGRENVRLLTVAPLSHAAASLAHALLPCGGTNVILSGFDNDVVLDTIEKERISHMFLPPTMLYSLLANPRCQTTDLSTIQMIVTAAAPIAPEKSKEAIRMFGPVLWEMFGQTETLMPILIKSPTDYTRQDGSIDEEILRTTGKAWDFVRVEIMDDDGNILKAGHPGEIVVRSAFNMLGYYRNPEATAEVSASGFHRTGDVGVMDERGFVTIVDRKKDMIVTGGFNVFPAEVEAVINGHPDVLDCIVVGAPHEKWGEQVVAVVEAKEGRQIDPEALRAYCRDRLGGMKAPKAIEIWPELPRSPVGKTLRREVRARFWADSWRLVG